MDAYANAELFCPHCQADLAVAMPEKNDLGRAPKHGDHTICSNCLAYLRYHEVEPGQLRLDEIGLDEFKRFPEQSQAALMQVRGEALARREQGLNRLPSRFETALMVEVTALKNRVALLESDRCECLYCRGGDSFNCLYRSGPRQ